MKVFDSHYDGEPRDIAATYDTSMGIVLACKGHTSKGFVPIARFCNGATAVKVRDMYAEAYPDCEYMIIH